MEPYAVVSDTHFHSFGEFSNEEEPRLDILTREFERFCSDVSSMGVKRVIHAGDLFHVRGKIKTSVMNAVSDLFKTCTRKYGLTFYILTGNHDLESRDSVSEMSAVEVIKGARVSAISSISVIRFSDSDRSQDQFFLFIPWFEDVDDLKRELEKPISGYKKSEITLVIHAPIDGVLMNIPGRGLDAPYLKSLGFKRVFSGHYHNHKDLGDEIFSVGAFTHQSWRDAGSVAGYIIVDEDTVTHYETSAPKFVNLDDEHPDLAQQACEGNFVKVSVQADELTKKQIETMKSELVSYGAKGVRIDVVSEPKTGRSAKAVKTGGSLIESVRDYIAKEVTADPDYRTLIEKKANELIDQTRAANS